MSFKKLFSLFQPAPHRPVQAKPHVVDENYRYWRMRIFYAMYAGYALFYLTRKSYTYSMTFITADLGYTKAQLGFLATVLYVSYGISKFASGVMSDRSNPRYFMAVGLLLTGLFNLMFGLSSSLLMFAIFWGLNGWFQGWGWPACTKLLTHWYSKTERGFYWSLSSTARSIGGAAAAWGIAKIAEHFGWRVAMYVPGVICILMGLWLMNRLRDVPQSLGLPTIEKFSNEPEEQGTSKDSLEDTRLTPSEILFEYVLVNPYVWLLSLSYFFTYFYRTALNDWSMMYLVEAKHYTNAAASAHIVWFEAGGLLGTLVAGWGSDKLFQGKRLPYTLICGIGLMFTLPLMWLMPDNMFWLNVSLMAVIGFFVFGPVMLVGLAVAEYVSKKAACTANGFAGCFAYAGAAATGYPLGVVVDKWGWYGFFVAMVFAAVLAMILTLPMFMYNMSNKKVAAAT